MGISLKQLDLNLLIVLREIIRTKSVSETAKSLNVTQPAISNSLSKLRVILGDPILVRGTSGYVLTSRAIELDRPICNSLRNLEAALQMPTPFNPLEDSRRFTISMTDYAEYAFGATLLAEFCKRAPKSRLGMRRLPAYTPVEELVRGDLDLCCAFRVEDHPGLMKKTLVKDDFVSILRSDHPALKKSKGKLTPEVFATIPQGLVSPIIESAETEFDGLVDEVLEKIGLKRHVVISVPHFHLACDIAAQSDLLFNVPKRITKAHQVGSKLMIIPIPIPMADFQSTLVWHERNNLDPAMIWLRDLISEVVSARR